MPGKNSDSSMVLVKGNKTKPNLPRMFSFQSLLSLSHRSDLQVHLCLQLHFCPPSKETIKCYVKVPSVPEEQRHRKLVFNWMLEFLPRLLACLEGGSTRMLS